MASHVSLNVSWASSLAIKSGSGVVHIWTKTTFDDDGSTATTESMSCGSALPVITTSAFAGNKKVLPEIPDTAWDSPSMPKFKGTMTRSGNTVMIDPGVALIGLTMENPTAAWPSRTAITGLDADGDGKLGLTAIPKDGDGFSPPPTSIQQTKFADKLYLVTRNIMTMQATQEGCPQTINGTASVTKFDNHVIGCHVKGGGECSDSEAQFVDDNRTVYTVGTASFVSKVIPETATCADIRAALPAN
jgi:hypothetical protein